MIVLSLFDGMSCGQIALKGLGLPITKYYASEIDKHAIATSLLNFPEMLHLGDISKWQSWDLPWASIDLILAGSPCQGFSFAGHQLAFDDPRSRLFWVFVDILRRCQSLNPNVRYLLENVRMKPEFERVISDTLGIQPVVINSALVSAQNRVRLYWSNIRTRQEGLFAEWVTDIPQPENRSITIQSILEDEVPERYYLSDKAMTWLERHGTKRGRQTLPILNDRDKSICLTTSNTTKYHLDTNFVRVGTYRTHKRDRGFRPMQDDKAPCLTARGREDGSGQACLQKGYRLRRLTPRECCRLQTIPEWYTWECSDSQIYKMLGNGWTVEVIKHILQYLNE